MSAHPCRACGAPLHLSFADLGAMPPCNAYLAAGDLERPEPAYPLHARVCEACWLVQVDHDVPPEQIFAEYHYFSSYSATMLAHVKAFAEMAIRRFGLGPESRVVEVASNDGYLLRNFVAAGIPALGVEPAANVAAVAIRAGVPTEVRFFGLEAARDLRSRGQGADLLVGNNVLAHVPDLNDFVAGLAALLEPAGVLSIEVPHLLRLMDEVQFDTIYHEHFSYFSLLALEAVLARHGLRVFDVEEHAIHGGSLRVFAGHDGAGHKPGPGMAKVRADEAAARLTDPATYRAFGARVEAAKAALVGFLRAARADGKTVVAYGAAGKGSTLLNACGVGPDLVAYAADANPHKQGRFMPGSHLPIVPPERIAEDRPDYVLILPWNLAEEITRQLGAVRDWGGRFVVPIPTTQVLP